MRGARYKERRECDLCGEVEDRDHILLRCGKWWEERYRVWKRVYGDEWVGDGWIDMRWMLFTEKGVKKLREFAIEVGWKEMVWEWGGWKGEERRKGREVVEWLRGCGGIRLKRRKEELERIAKWNRERMKKRRGILTQATTATTTVVTGAKRLTREMVKDGWERVKGGGIVKRGKDKGLEENRKVLGMLNGNRGKRYVGDGKGVDMRGG